MNEQGWRGFLAAQAVEDWVVLHGGATGRAPSPVEIAARFQLTPREVEDGLRRLQDEANALVLLPGGTYIWMAEPFSVPTSFLVRSGTHQWWGNCIWDALAILALVDTDGSVFESAQRRHAADGLRPRPIQASGGQRAPGAPALPAFNGERHESTLFPVKDPTSSRPLGNPDAGSLDCGPAAAFPMPADTKSTCSQNIGQIGARYAHYHGWHQPFLLSWMHVDKTVWNGLSAEQRAAIVRAARESVTESYQATESIACRKLKDILDVNDGIAQRNPDGTVRLVDGRPVSARITLAPWPEEALKVLRIATSEYLSSLAGPSDASARTDTQREFATVSDAMTRFAGSAGATTLAGFPATTGLTSGETCRLAP